MRILGVTFTLPHAEACSGAGLVMQGEYTALLERHDLTLVSFAVTEPSEQKALAHLRASGVKVHLVGGSLPHWLVRARRRWQRAITSRASTSSSFGGLTFFDFRMQRLLDHLLAQKAFDLLQVESIGFLDYRFRTNIPSILIEHEVGRSGQSGQPRISPQQLALWRQFDRVQVFTSRDAATIRRLAPELAGRVRINPFGIELGDAAGRDREEPGLIIFVGGFNHSPNVDAALWLGQEIMPLLRRICPAARLEIVGSNPPAAVRALASQDLTVTGRVPDVTPYLERASVVLAPVRLGGGMRVKVLQAMAMGKAVVTTPLGAEGIMVAAEMSPLRIASDAEGIAQATGSLLASAEARWNLGQQARALVAEYHSWAAYRQRLEAIYGELLAGGMN